MARTNLFVQLKFIKIYSVNTYIIRKNIVNISKLIFLFYIIRKEA